MTNKRINIKGNKYGELTVIELSDKRGKDGTRLWECLCSCRKVIHVHSYSLIHGNYKSCGCKRIKNRDIGVREHIKSDSVDGTRKSALKAKLHANNKSGVKGVRFNQQRNKWTAHIGYKGKQISLGYFDNKYEAVKARKRAEDKYHKPHLEDDK